MVADKGKWSAYWMECRQPYAIIRLCYISHECYTILPVTLAARRAVVRCGAVITNASRSTCMGASDTPLT